MSSLTNKRNFMKEFERLIKIKRGDEYLFKTQRAAFDHLNTTYENIHGEPRYANYESFRVCKCRMRKK